MQDSGRAVDLLSEAAEVLQPNFGKLERRVGLLPVPAEPLQHMATLVEESPAKGSLEFQSAAEHDMGSNKQPEPIPSQRTQLELQNPSLNALSQEAPKQVDKPLPDQPTLQGPPPTQVGQQLPDQPTLEKPPLAQVDKLPDQPTLEKPPLVCKLPDQTMLEKPPPAQVGKLPDQPTLQKPLPEQVHNPLPDQATLQKPLPEQVHNPLPDQATLQKPLPEQVHNPLPDQATLQKPRPEQVEQPAGDQATLQKPLQQPCGSRQEPMTEPELEKPVSHESKPENPQPEHPPIDVALDDFPAEAHVLWLSM